MRSGGGGGGAPAATAAFDVTTAGAIGGAPATAAAFDVTTASARGAAAAPADTLATDIAGFTHDPLGHALYAYPWGEGALAGIAGPRRWQRTVLQAIGDHLSDPATRCQPLQIAVASGHGVGKSAPIAMIVKWGLDTC